MLFPSRFWPDLAAGTITVAFRRWKRPTVKASGTLQSPGGLLAIDEVAAIDEDDISPEDALAAGYGDVGDLIGDLPAEGPLYRIRFHRLGEDPRVALRQQAALDDEELGQLRAALDRLGWAWSTLRLIAARPGVVSTQLAAVEGVDRPVFKRRVRRLKALGLTESLDVGYRLSPRGRTLLASFADDR